MMVTNNENQGLNPVEQAERMRFPHKINCDCFGESVRDWGENDWYDNWYDDDKGSNGRIATASSVRVRHKDI